MELREGDGGTWAVDSRCLSIAETGGVVPGRWQAGLGHEVALRKGTKRRAPGRRITLQLCGAAIVQEPIEARRVDPVAGGRSESYDLDRRHRPLFGDPALKTELSALEARRIALAAQGFVAISRGGAVGAARIRAAIGRLGLLQIDSVNVLARAHYLPLFSRLGPYDRDLLDAVSVARPKRFFEYWGHEASLLPVDLQPLLRWRMARALRGQGVWQRLEPFAGEKRAEADALLARIEREGPLAASDVAGGRATKGMWEWSDAKHALEWLFWSGQVASTHRRSSFERDYDLPERVLPRAVLEIPTPTGVDARRALLARSAKALGIATAHDLRDYYRIPPADAVPAIEQLIEDGTLVPVHVRGWRHQAYLHRDAKPGRRLGASALLSPFDPLVWHRPRTERLFGFRYRLEIYTPAHKREHGYYVLPFLMDGALVARVDLKADRKVGALVVQRAHVEPGAPADTAERLLGELRLTASWLGLPSLVVSPVAAHPGLEDVRDIEAHSSAAGSPVSTIRSDLIASA